MKLSFFLQQINGACDGHSVPIGSQDGQMGRAVILPRGKVCSIVLRVIHGEGVVDLTPGLQTQILGSHICNQLQNNRNITRTAGVTRSHKITSSMKAVISGSPGSPSLDLSAYAHLKASAILW